MPPARLVRLRTPSGREVDLVVRAGTAPAGRGEPVAELHALDRLDRHQRPGEPRVELPVPLGEAAKSRRQPVRRATSTTPPSVSPSLRAASTSAIIAALVSASAQRTGSASIRARSSGAGGGASSGTATEPSATTCETISTPSDWSSSRRATSPSATRAAVSRALARSRIGPGVGVPELLHARQVGVAGPRPGQRGVARLVARVLPGVDRVGRHDRLPLGPLGVAHPDRDRPAKRDAVPHAAGELHLVLLELHPRAAPVPGPPPRERGRHVPLVIRTPAGTPSQIAASARPCDSPAVSHRNMLFTLQSARPGCRHAAAAARAHRSLRDSARRPRMPERCRFSCWYSCSLIGAATRSAGSVESRGA